MKKINIIIILFAVFSIILLSGCTNKQVNSDNKTAQTCSIDQVEHQQICK